MHSLGKRVRSCERQAWDLPCRSLSLALSTDPLLAPIELHALAAVVHATSAVVAVAAAAARRRIDRVGSGSGFERVE